MESSLHATEEEAGSSNLGHQALSFFLHAALALATWFLIMLVGYALNPPNVSQLFILVLCLAVPFVVGFLVNRFRQNEMAGLVWLLGLIWILVIALWVLDMPTGPNQCFQCDATTKLSRTFLSLPEPSGLVDNDGPFIATWPAAALLGYAIGARIAYKKPEPEPAD
jgi:hypothetical protein